jgi:hypothetical protein
VNGSCPKAGDYLKDVLIYWKMGRRKVREEDKGDRK